MKHFPITATIIISERLKEHPEVLQAKSDYGLQDGMKTSLEWEWIREPEVKDMCTGRILHESLNHWHLVIKKIEGNHFHLEIFGIE